MMKPDWEVWKGAEKWAGSELNPFCDRIVPRSENDDNHDRFALHRVNKLRGLRYRSPTDSRRLPKKLKRNAYHHCGHQPMITAAG